MRRSALFFLATCCVLPLSTATAADLADAAPAKEAPSSDAAEEMYGFWMQTCETGAFVEVQLSLSQLPTTEEYYRVVDDLPMTDIPVCFGAPGADECCKTVLYDNSGGWISTHYTSACDIASIITDLGLD